MIRFLLMCFMLSVALSVHAENNSWRTNANVLAFINEMAENNHFDKENLIKLFEQINVRPVILKKNTIPIETKPWYLYQLMFVTNKRIRDGLIFWQRYEKALLRAEQEFGVPASIIVATIGIETKYGQETGKYRVIDALVNLAFGEQSTRKKFFRKELVHFLCLTKEQDIDPLSIKGSYSGAIGQPQFMPSSYRHYAVNFSGNPKIDLSHNEIDVIGSIANFYKQNGWRKNQLIALPASRKGGQFQFPIGKKSISFSEMISIGNASNAMETSNGKCRHLVLQKNYTSEHWQLYHNFEVIRRYNHSDLYAMAVFQLSFFINALRGNQICLSP